METAKVDIRKLQLLCDRITQTIEALNQVRLSVHGLTHSNVDPRLVGGIPAAGVGVGVGVPGLGFGIPSSASGFSGLSAQVAPYGLGGFPQASLAGTPWGAFGGIPGAGISHSTSDVSELLMARAADPFLSVRVAQTFPYVFSVLPPAMGI